MKLLKLLFLIVLSSHVLSQTATLEKNQGLRQQEDIYSPSPILYLDCEQQDNYIFLIEKRGQTFYVLKAVDTTYQVERTFICSTGKVSGDKIKSGDKKTPEGIYFIREKKEPKSLAPIYGAGAFVLDYPNSFDAMTKKNGHGIWIHGTDLPERIQNSNDTNGCVVLVNEDFNSLCEYVSLNQTPVIIVDEVLYRNQKYVYSDKLELIRFLNQWRSSWENRNIDAFMDCYSGIFKQEHMKKRAYRNYKARMFKQYNEISLVFGDIQIFRDKNKYVISFYQEYTTENYNDFGIKQLYILKENNHLEIIKETWHEKTKTPNS